MAAVRILTTESRAAAINTLIRTKGSKDTIRIARFFDVYRNGPQRYRLPNWTFGT
jgi:hypothetical protein